VKLKAIEMRLDGIPEMKELNIKNKTYLET